MKKWVCMRCDQYTSTQPYVVNIRVDKSKAFYKVFLINHWNLWIVSQIGICVHFTKYTPYTTVLA